MLDKLKIPPQLRQKIDKELQPQESIRWISQHQPKVSSLIDGFLISLFAIPLIGAGVFFTHVALVDPIPDLKTNYGIVLVGVLLILMGLALLSLPFWRWHISRSVYIITHQRLITFYGANITTIRSFEPQQLEKIYRRENNDGTGDVVVVVRSWKGSDGNERKEEVGFLAISNPQQVETLLKELAQTAL